MGKHPTRFRLPSPGDLGGLGFEPLDVQRNGLPTTKREAASKVPVLTSELFFLFFVGGGGGECGNSRKVPEAESGCVCFV